MAINFCHQQFHTQISSNRVSVEGHEATQLISPGKKGFIAETFIRPPVTLVVTFACNIDVQRVVICGKVGAQKSIGYELFSYSERRNATKLGQHQYQFSDSYVCQPIGKLFSNDKTMFSFISTRHRPREPFVGIDQMPSHNISPGDLLETQLRSHNPRNLINVSYLIVRILRTVAGSVPCVGWLEVWGQPSFSSHKQIIADVFSIYKSIMCPEPVLTKGNSLCQTSEDQTNKQDNDCSEIDIPEDFIDPITQEIMMLPVLLPSGLTVDQTTLDRHEKEEAKWGRSAGDPFTGVAFSKTNIPQQNTALKVRIDQFLLKNGSDINIPNRTLGAQKIGARNATVSSLTKIIPSCSSASAASSLPNYQPLQKITNAMTSELLLSSTNNLTKGPARKKIKTEPTSIKVKPTVGSDLDSLLEEALSGLPSYTTLTPGGNSVQNPQLSKPDCSVCQTVVEISSLYKLGCEHNICRFCLLRKQGMDKKINCPRCSQVTNSCDIVKAHH